MDESELQEILRQRAQMTPEDHWRENEYVRIMRIRENAKRPPGFNLAEAISLSEFQMSFRIVPKDS